MARLVSNKLRVVLATETRTATHLETSTVTLLVDDVYTTDFETVVVETQTITSTSIVTSLAPSSLKLRRQLSTVVSDYPAASISSACSCLNVRPCNFKGTTTIAAATETSVATVTVDATETLTATEVATMTIPTTVTKAATATTVVTVTSLPKPVFNRIFTVDEQNKKWYFKKVAQDAGDLIVAVEDPAEAIDTFQLAHGLLSYVSSSYNVQVVFPYFATLWFSNNTPKKLIFNTAEYIDEWQSGDWYHYQWVIDAQTGALTATNAGNPVFSQMCLAGINMQLEQELMLGTAVTEGSFCIGASMWLELV